MKRKVFGTILTLMILASVVAVPVLAAPAGSWVTDFTLYNLNDTSASIQITRYNMFANGGTADSGTSVKDVTINANDSFYYNPAQDSSFTPGFQGSIVVSSTQQLVGTVTIANNFTGKAYASDAYSAVVTPSQTQYLPIIMGKLGVWNTRISVQNADTVATNVTITYIGAGAPQPTVIQNLPPNMTVQVDQYDNQDMNGFNGSAVVTSNQNLAVVVEEYRTTGGMLVMYNGISEKDTTVYMPGYINQGAWNTDFTIVNTTASKADITVSFTGLNSKLTGSISGNGSVYLNKTLPTGWSGTFPTNYYGAATITSSQPVVVAYNIANTAVGGAGNLGMGYVGFPQSAASNNAVVPLIENLYSTGWGTTFSVQSIDGTPANLTLKYSGNKTPLCNPCTYNMSANEASHTFNQGSDKHVPQGFIGGVSVSSNKPIVVIADQNNAVAAIYRNGDAAAGFPGFKK